ncbi:MAG TPA: winged helix-turn-helix domain-containing protein, partial [Blastocatellia bacterium]|nr:winged helix-turn-helix domain-containing protein [Blastocatellia bacterium]
MSSQNKHLYEFGPFRVDASERLLMRESEVVPLTAKVFDLLLLLIRNRGHALSKDELMGKLWPDTA